MLKEEIQHLLNQLIQVENNSSYLYTAMSNHLARLNYTGMANWLKLQAAEEKTHADKLMTYVIDRGGKVQLMALPEQSADFGSPLETFQKVLEHERFVTNSYQKSFDYLAGQNDQQTSLIVQDILREQIDETAQAEVIIGRLKIAADNPSAILILDQELGQRK
ncbi:MULTISPECIES: ferritin [unclassified Bacillus (in: firmicutes)]|uniref:ferritin n=1 Tax=unclassified Bacillus (in: firmicutes) TaxID=185979 RepID=UPI0008F06957|nr:MULTISPECIES: ferritin [unclassified Bacillus (in: firmicutes)]SFB08739.1 ferritin [Bacillus sp. UNCCL13]SFQ86964.1 ferritin [Bacillus sp. cl95]